MSSHTSTTRSNLTAVGDSVLYNNGFKSLSIPPLTIQEWDQALFQLTGNDNTPVEKMLSKPIQLFITASGSGAHINVTGASNTAIGNAADVTTGALTNATAIGANAMVNASNKVRIGDATVTVIEGAVAFSPPSDARFKDNIQEDVQGLDFIMKLRPVSYNFNRLKYAVCWTKSYSNWKPSSQPSH
jgi:hypothetical protein